MGLLIMVYFVFIGKTLEIFSLHIFLMIFRDNLYICIIDFNVKLEKSTATFIFKPLFNMLWDKVPKN